MKGTVRRALDEAIRTLAGSETLDELPQSPGDRARGSFIEWLMKPESLPMDEPVAGRPRRTLLSLIVSAEPLPRDGAPGAGDPAGGRPGAGRAA